MGGKKADIKFIYNEPALILTESGKNRLVVGDLHIGVEREFKWKGINMRSATEMIANRIVGIASSFKANDLIILGDLKNRILRLDYAEVRMVKSFLEQLNDSGLRVHLAIGNHDAYTGDFSGLLNGMSDEIIIGDIALMHGHRWPSDKAMSKGTIITAHNHFAIGIYDSNGAFYNSKVWLVAKANRKELAKRYENGRATRLIVMPAFNDLIMGGGFDIEHSAREDINPLFRNGIFDFDNAEIYGLDGAFIGRAADVLRMQRRNGPKIRKRRA
ncbi:metallophosphoesterase [Candidatus Marsarchaeota archaeon]|jgi:putative SbcD/Mre11-related phosphoesterase|nr:metallophosphoesterase [Candidatus Marsarchaeota archaeon]MCL5092779.1 metallophosphoesterase [Candidatus Marsarchaeota archaeon]